MEDNNFMKKLSSLSEVSRVQLSKILNSCSSPKDLFLEPSIIKPLERICGVKWLKGNNVNKIYKIDNTPALQTGNTEIYMIYTNLNSFENVVNIIRSKLDPEKPDKNKHHIILVPKVLQIFEDTLEELGLYGTVIKLYSFQWLPINIDTRILSMELPQMYKHIFVNNDYALLSAYARNLWQLFFIFGKPKFTLGLGNHSSAVLDQLEIFREELGDTDKFESDFGGMILIDRNIDYPSVLLTPGTYAALLNELYSVSCGSIEYKKVDGEKYDKKYNIKINKLPININLDSKKDIIYSDIKNRYFTEVTAVLSTMTKQLRSEGESSKAMALDEIKVYVKNKLQEATAKKKLIVNHLQAAESIINVLGSRFEKQQGVERSIILNQSKAANFGFLEELITIENDKFISLRLMCLLSLTQKLSESELKGFWNKYILEYGYKYGYVYNNLIKASFIPEPTNTNLSNKIMSISKLLTNNFYINVNKLKQVPNDPDKIDLKAPTSSSYVFAGYYIPLISIIANMLVNGTPLEEVRSKLDLFGQTTIQNEKGYPLEKRSVLICVIGGISYAEIAACNLLETLTQTKITVLTDRVISGNDIMESLF